MPLVIELEHEFAERNNNHFVLIDGGRRKLFSTGAIWDIGTRRGIESPTDTLERLRLQLRFHATVANIAKDTFTRLKGILLGYRPQIGGFHWDRDSLNCEATADGLRDLQTLQRIHAEHSKKASALKSEIAKLPQIIEQKINAERQRMYEAQRRHAAEKFRTQVESLTLDESNGAFHVDNERKNGEVYVDNQDHFLLES